MRSTLKVFITKPMWEGFLRRAKKAFPNEHLEAIWGTETIDGFRIARLSKVVYTSNNKELGYKDWEIKKQDSDARKAGLSCLGSIHTHPSKSYDTCPSTEDHKDGAKDGERLVGIVVLYKKKDNGKFHYEADWWMPQPPLALVFVDE